VTRHVLSAYGTEKWFDRVADGSVTALVVSHIRDYQIGDCVVLVRDNRAALGNRKDIPEDERWDLIEVTVTHVMPSTVDKGVAEGCVLLSFKDRSDVYHLLPEERGV
jgi:hypothetical protein